MMPTVARLMAQKRRTLGDARMAECWRCGVTVGEPGQCFLMLADPRQVGQQP